MPDPTSPRSPTCPECGKGRLVVHFVAETFDLDLGEETVQVHATGVPVERCDRCGLELSGPEAAQVRHEATCRAAGFFTPADAKAVRQRLGLSQEEFARLAGVGVATISRLERGRLLPNRSTDNLLFLLSESAEARRLLEERVAARTRRRAEGTAGGNGNSLGGAAVGKSVSERVL